MPEIAGLHIIPALVILLREIIVSGLREFLAPAPGFDPGQRARQVEDHLPAGRAWRADPRRGVARTSRGFMMSASSAFGRRPP